MPSLRQSNKPLEQLTERHRKFAELLADGKLSRMDCMAGAGFSRDSDPQYIGSTRERSKYPALWDYYDELRKRRLRLFDIGAKEIKQELELIARAKLTDFVSIPTRNDLEKQALLDAHIRRSMGYTDEEHESLLSREKEILAQELSESRKGRRKNQSYAPGASVKIRALEDIPEEFLPALESIHETRDGIKIRLFDKLKALELLAKINRLFDDPNQTDKPTTIENLNLIVNGSKSDLLDKLKDV